MIFQGNSDFCRFIIIVRNGEESHVPSQQTLEIRKDNKAPLEKKMLEINDTKYERLICFSKSRHCQLKLLTMQKKRVVAISKYAIYSQC